MPVYKDDNGTYFFEIKYRDPFSGERKNIRRRGFEKRKEAVEEERKAILDLKIAKPNNIMFEEALTTYLRSRKGKTKDRSLYDVETTARKHILPYFTKIPLSKINKAAIEKWQEKLLELDLATSYLDTIQNVFSTIMNFSARNEWITHNPFRNVDKIKNFNKPLKKMGFWTYEEYQLFRSKIDDDNYLMLFDLLYYTGMRIGELQALRWKDFDHVKRELFVHSTYDPKNKAVSESTKNGEARYIVLNKSLADGLKMRLVKCRKIYDFTMDGFIFGYDEVLSQKTITNNKDRYIKLANEDDILNRIRLHDFRHSHVSLLINNGFTPFEIASRLGHTPSMVEQTYSHMFKSTQNRMADFLESL